MAGDHIGGAGPGLARGPSGAAGAPAPHKRLVVLPTAAWGKGYESSFALCSVHAGCTNPLKCR